MNKSLTLFSTLSLSVSHTDCGKCKASPKKLNLNKFCMEDYGAYT